MSEPTGTAPTGDAGPAIARIVAGGMRDVPDYPKEGVLFKDIVPLLVDADAFGATIAALGQLGAAALGLLGLFAHPPQNRSHLVVVDQALDLLGGALRRLRQAQHLRQLLLERVQLSHLVLP